MAKDSKRIERAKEFHQSFFGYSASDLNEIDLEEHRPTYDCLVQFYNREKGNNINEMVGILKKVFEGKANPDVKVQFDNEQDEIDYILDITSSFKTLLINNLKQ